MRTYTLVTVLAIALAGCAVLAAVSDPVISEISEDQVKIVITMSEFTSDEDKQAALQSVQEKASEGCALHGREAVGISVASRKPMGATGMEIEQEHLFACVESDE